MPAAWFLASEDGQPQGMWLQEREDPTPLIGERIQGNDGWQEAEVIAFQELSQVCAMRRYRVVIRVLR